jgi:hypothetical protein
MADRRFADSSARQAFSRITSVTSKSNDRLSFATMAMASSPLAQATTWYPSCVRMLSLTWRTAASSSTSSTFWLARLAGWGLGACLADDMGLGKTVQALRFSCGELFCDRGRIPALRSTSARRRRRAGL